MRASGRTFRICMGACLAASGGEHVFIITDKERDAVFIQHMLRDILRVLANVDFKRNVITFPPKNENDNHPGTINFAGENPSRRGYVEHVKRTYKCFYETH